MKSLRARQVFEFSKYSSYLETSSAATKRNIASNHLLLLATSQSMWANTA